jgi:acyl dehydratase
MAHADPEPGVLDVDLAPSQRFLGMVFTIAHGMFVRAISEYVALARPEKQSVADKIESDFMTAWKK